MMQTREREREREKKGGLPSGVVFKAHMPIKAVTLTILLVSRLIDPKPVEVQSPDTSVGMRVMRIDSTSLVLSTSAQLKHVIAIAN